MACSSLPLLALLAILGITVASSRLPSCTRRLRCQRAQSHLAPSLPRSTQGLDNPDIISNQNIHPARTCGFCMGVSVFSRALVSRSFSTLLLCAKPRPFWCCLAVIRADKFPRLQSLRPSQEICRSFLDGPKHGLSKQTSRGDHLTGV